VSRSPATLGAGETRTLDLVIVGCGAVVEGLYRGALSQLESQGVARVAALVDPNPARTAALQRHFRRARPYRTLAEALAWVKPALTVVASPPAWHAENAVEALRAGSHVLCEKPMATSTADAVRMVEAARAAGRVLAIGMFRRLFPCLSEARALLAEGVCGERLRFTYREGSVVRWPVSTDAAFHRSSAGGGVLTDVGSHVLDFLAGLFGPLAISAYADDALNDGVEANCRIEVTAPGATGVVQLSWNQPLVTGLSIVGTKGELALHPGRPDSVRWRVHGGRWHDRASTVSWPSDLRQGGRRRIPRSQWDCMYQQLVLALRAVVHGEPVPAAGDDGLATARAIDACYERATPLSLDWFTPHEQASVAARHWSAQRWLAT
jgi:predicted dehydrogenase